MLWQNFIGHGSAWYPLLSACCHVEFDIFVICRVFMHCLASFLLQEMRSSLHEFALEETNYAKVCLKTFSCFLQLSDRAYVSLVAVYAQVCWLFRVLYVSLFGFVQGRPCGERRTRTKMLFVIRMCLLYLQTVLITTGPVYRWVHYLGISSKNKWGFWSLIADVLITFAQKCDWNKSNL